MFAEHRDQTVGVPWDIVALRLSKGEANGEGDEWRCWSTTSTDPRVWRPSGSGGMASGASSSLSKRNLASLDKSARQVLGREPAGLSPRNGPPEPSPPVETDEVNVVRATKPARNSEGDSRLGQ